MSRATAENNIRDVHRSEGSRAPHACKIPRRAPPPGAAPPRPPLAARPIAKSTHDANITKLRNDVTRYSNAVLGKSTLRSRSQDERSRGFVRPGSARPISPAAPPTSARGARIDRSSSKDKKSKVPKKTFDGLVIHVHSEDDKKDLPKHSNAPTRYAEHNKKTSINIALQRCQEREEVETRLHAPHSTASGQSVILKMGNSPSLESIPSTDHLTTQLKTSIEKKRSSFMKRNTDVNAKQVLAEMKAAQSQLVALGGRGSAAEAAAAKLQGGGAQAPGTPLSCGGDREKDHDFDGALESLALLPNGLVSCCDAALSCQKEVVRWLNTLLTSEEKGISTTQLSIKVHEFTSEHAQLVAVLDSTRDKFADELKQAVDILRKGRLDREKLMHETERLSVKVAELTSKNDDLHLQLLSADYPKLVRGDKSKIGELEKALKEERCKRSIVRERLARAEALHKVESARAADLEEALEMAGGEVQQLQTSVHQLQEQNLNIQMEFDGKLIQLTESLKNNMSEFQEVADARERLEMEKKDFENQMEKYKVSVECMKVELNTTVEKLFEAETQKCEALEENRKLHNYLNNINNEVKECKAQNNELLKQLKEKEIELEDKEDLEIELTNATEQLEKYKSELQEMEQKVEVQGNLLSELQRNNQRYQHLKDSLTQELKEKEDSIMEIKTQLMSELRTKTDYIVELKKKLEEMEELLQESESKLELYDNRLQSLKQNLGYQPQDDEEASMDCFTELRDLIIEQKNKLLEATRQNGELAEELKKREAAAEQSSRALEAQCAELARRDDADLDHARALDRLRDNLELRAQGEFQANKKLVEKTEEVEILLSNVEKRKQEIHQLEEIILTLEEQLCKTNLVKKTQHEKISALERMVMQGRTSSNRREVPTDKLNRFISILEAELGSSNTDAFANAIDDSFSVGVKTCHCGESGGGGSRRAIAERGARERRRTDDSDSSLGDIYHSLVKKVSPMLLDNIRHESAYYSESERCHGREPTDCGPCNHAWSRRPQHNINVYHTLRTDIELARRGSDRRERSPSPRDLVTRRPALSLGAPRDRRSQRSLSKPAYNAM